MMDKGKKIEVSSSTLVDLKAELYRKQEELKRSKGKHESISKTTLKLGQKFRSQVDQLGKSNPGLAARIAKDKESQFIETSEDQDALVVSRRKLEEKAKLYEKMMTTSMNVSNEDEEDGYMVDFQRKQLENLNKVSEPTKKEAGSEKCENYEPKSEAEEWVDYTDSLGRSRRCLRTDLPNMIAMDQELQSRKVTRSPSQSRESDTEPEQLDDVTETTAAAGPLHYQNVQFNEIRSHGVGYFAFSQSEEERKQQLDMLNQLRDQTKEQKARVEKLKEKRKAALKARLEKVKQRKRLKTGEVLSESDSDKSETEVTEQEETSNKEPMQASVEENLDKKIEPLATVRPWDRGKIGVTRTIQPFRKASQKEWIERRRDERPTEFAPPQAYYKRDPVEEMHAFFKEQQVKHSQQPVQSNFSAVPTVAAQNISPVTVDNIPLPPNYDNSR